MSDEIVISQTMIDYMKKKCERYESNYTFHRFHYSCGDGYDVIVGVTCVKRKRGKNEVLHKIQSA